MTFDFLSNIAILVLFVEFKRKSEKMYDKKMVLVGPPESTSKGWILLFYGSGSKTGSTRGVFR
jgi:hypothetical protein